MSKARRINGTSITEKQSVEDSYVIAHAAFTENCMKAQMEVDKKEVRVRKSEKVSV